MIEPFDMVDLIHVKRNKQKLSREQIAWMVDAYTRGYVSNEQMSAMLMAIFLNGMGSEETYALTMSMIDSGERMSFKNLGKPTTDKHSTGGVGDKITLPLTPLVASFGVAVPQLSGRGLGHTGGTLDKLESISGWRANITNEEMFKQLQTVGGTVCAAGSGLAPADGKLYSLRDVTGTVDSVPLIASSIMSKKIAEGTESLVLDVKFGSGAFLKNINDSRKLAEVMVKLGKDAGLNMTAFLTNMDVPLGYAIGNANEVQEALDVLAGGGPSDVVELTVAFAKEMLELAGMHDVDVAEHLKNGKAMDSWNAMITSQGGDPDASLPTPKNSHTVFADTDGYLTKQEALPFGIAAWRLGAGRARKEDPVHHAAGIDLHAKYGDKISKGQPLFTMHTDDETLFERATEALQDSYQIGAVEPEKQQLIAEHIKG